MPSRLYRWIKFSQHYTEDGQQTTVRHHQDKPQTAGGKQLNSIKTALKQQTDNSWTADGKTIKQHTENSQTADRQHGRQQ